MSWDHERVESLLAAGALGGLDGDDAELMERALLEHVPECERCRRAHEEYEALAGDLALVAPPEEPPDGLRARVRRTVKGGRSRRPGGSRALIAGVAAAAVIVGMVALASWNLVLADSLGDARLRQGWMVDAMTTLGNPSSEVVPLGGGADVTAAVMYVEGREGLYLIAAHLPDPEGVYRVWFISGSQTWSPGILETDFGSGMLPIRTSIERWDWVMVTEEPDTDSPTPAASPVVSATFD